MGVWAVSILLGTGHNGRSVFASACSVFPMCQVPLFTFSKLVARIKQANRAWPTIHMTISHSFSRHDWGRKVTEIHVRIVDAKDATFRMVH